MNLEEDCGYGLHRYHIFGVSSISPADMHESLKIYAVDIKKGCLPAVAALSGKEKSVILCYLIPCSIRGFNSLIFSGVTVPTPVSI
jgi:hypothetical protein